MGTVQGTGASRKPPHGITVSGGSDNNYAFAYVAGTLTMTAALPAVTTATAEAIGTTTATSGGTVTNDGGATATARGVCWSTAANPTVANAKTADGAGTGYGAPQSFTTPVAKGADFVATSIVMTPALPAVGEKGDKSASVSTLKPGVSKTVKMSLTAPKTWGTFTLRALIDAKNGVKEDDEYNNQETYVYNTGLPDFEILDVSLSPELPLAGNAGYLDLWADSSALLATPVPGAKTKGNKYKTVGTLKVNEEKVIKVTGLKTALSTNLIFC